MRLHEPSPDCGVKCPWYICGPQDQNPIVVISNTWVDKGDTGEPFAFGPSCDLLQLTLHLYEELGLDPTRSFALVLTPGATEGVDLIDENDGGLVFSG